jgi:hypothetical protein
MNDALHVGRDVSLAVGYVRIVLSRKRVRRLRYMGVAIFVGVIHEQFARTQGVTD